MAYQGISTGTSPNDNNGDSLLTGAIKINSNFVELYSALGDGSSINFSPITSGIQTGISVTYNEIDNKVNFATHNITTTSVDKTLTNLEYCTVESDGLTLTLPTSPSVGNRIMIGIGGNYNSTVIARNSSNIMGLAEDMTVDNGHVTLSLIYINSTLGWRIS